MTSASVIPPDPRIPATLVQVSLTLFSANKKVINVKKTVIVFILVLSSLYCFEPYSISKSASTGTIRGYVLLPSKIDMPAVPKEAKVYIYLKNYTPQNGKEVFPWNAPIIKVMDFDIGSLRTYKLAFEFTDLPKGTYGVSVLVDTGRPHIPHGSLNFTAFPGDYTGGTRKNVNLDCNQTVEVSIDEGLYVTIPDGYEAPLYSTE